MPWGEKVYISINNFLIFVNKIRVPHSIANHKNDINEKQIDRSYEKKNTKLNTVHTDIVQASPVEQAWMLCDFWMIANGTYATCWFLANDAHAHRLKLHYFILFRDSIWEESLLEMTSRVVKFSTETCFLHS